MRRCFSPLEAFLRFPVDLGCAVNFGLFLFNTVIPENDMDIKLEKTISCVNKSVYWKFMLDRTAAKRYIARNLLPR